MPEPRINKDLCRGCTNCALACPRGVLVEPKAGLIPSIKTPNECTNCKRCIDACPFDAIRIVEIVTV